MSRRTSERHARRVEVRFWRRGHDQPHSGFTVDLSKTGLFLATSLSLEPGERLRLEIVDKENGFQVEGQVARVHRVAQALRHVQQSGAGIRFLGPGDLVAGLLNAGRPKAPGGERHVASAAAPAPAPPETPATAAAPQASAPARRDSLEDLFGPDPDADSAPAPAPPAAPPPAPAPPPAARPARSVAVEFVDRSSFLSVFHRDIAAGGLFVTTDSPAELHEVVLVELRLPMTTSPPLRFEARVVHRLDPRSGSGAAGLNGMGVQFLDPDRVRAALAPIVGDARH